MFSYAILYLKGHVDRWTEKINFRPMIVHIAKENCLKPRNNNLLYKASPVSYAIPCIRYLLNTFYKRRQDTDLTG